MKIVCILDNAQIVNIYNNEKTEKAYNYPVYLFIKKRRNFSAAGSADTFKINDTEKSYQNDNKKQKKIKIYYKPPVKHLISLSLVI